MISEEVVVEKEYYMQEYMIVACFISNEPSQITFITWFDRFNSKLSSRRLMSSNVIGQGFFYLCISN